MNGVKLCFSGMIAVAIAIPVGCSSSSTAPVGPVDSGVSPEANLPDAPVGDAAPVGCNPVLGQLCGAGETCCFSGLLGTCVESGSCGAPFQVECISKASCGGTDVCCGSVQLPVGFDASGFASGFDASGFDASGFDASGIDASGFDASGFGLTLACAAQCTAPNFQLCTSTKDCPAGDLCSGGPDGVAFGLLMACVPADAGLPAHDAGLESGSPEAAAPVDAGADDGG